MTQERSPQLSDETLLLSGREPELSGARAPIIELRGVCTSLGEKIVQNNLPSTSSIGQKVTFTELSIDNESLGVLRNTITDVLPELSPEALITIEVHNQIRVSNLDQVDRVGIDVYETHSNRRTRICGFLLGNFKNGYTYPLSREARGIGRDISLDEALTIARISDKTMDTLPSKEDATRWFYAIDSAIAELRNVYQDSTTLTTLQGILADSGVDIQEVDKVQLVRPNDRRALQVWILGHNDDRALRFIYEYKIWRVTAGTGSFVSTKVNYYDSSDPTNLNRYAQSHFDDRMLAILREVNNLVTSEARI